MTDEAILSILKMDLQICVNSLDAYLNNIVLLAKKQIETEGIVLTDSVDDGMLVEMYAAYLYRKRKESVNAMPRMLRYALNNRLLSQKAEA